MIEKIILNYLTASLDVPCVMEVPAEVPERFVRIERTGGTETNTIESATLAIQSYAGSLYEAAELNEAVKAVLRTANRLEPVASCRLNSDYNFTDTASKRYRYQAVYDVVML